MKKILFFFAFALGASCSVFAQNPVPAVAEKSPADVDDEALWAIFRAEPPAGVEFPSREFFKYQDQKSRKFSEAARAFAEKYPNDPRRYNGWVQSSYTRPWFILDFKPEFDEKPGERNVVVDEPALAAYRAQQAELLTKVIEAPDSVVRQRGGAFFALIADTRGAAASAKKDFDITVFRPLVDRVVASYPDERALPVVEQYVQGLRRQSPEAADAYEAGLQANPVIAAAMKAAAEQQKIAQEEQAKKTALAASDLGSVKFTAADGREVDLSKLKGKVVLVDFWATWCGPCVAEIPNVVANYKKYHDKGFEVIGISLENPDFRPKDTDEQKALKMTAAKEKMLAFAAKHEMPWPQYFDGKWWKNDYAQKFGIEAIPAVFLLDQEGKVAATEARGPQLEVEIKRLLKL